MYFNTLSFFSFFLAVYLVYQITSPSRIAGAILLSASIAFYLVAGVFDSLLIATLITLNWLLVALVRHDQARISLAVIINVGVLALIKYQAFFSTNSAGEGTAFIDTVLPLGISFYTFQLLAYQVDAKNEPDLKNQSFFSFTLFISFFPQLIAGPIVRAKELVPQIRRVIEGRRRKLKLVSFGLGLCLLGLTKKVFLADSLAPVVDDIFYLESPSIYQAWLGAWLFSFQIYFDFSGYSDIALGCAYLLGIRLPWNFRTPYMSVSPREFWRRWHITLSSWIRDYLYIPLGGNRGGPLRQVATLLLVMGLAGLWHGADFTFIVWGLGWGAYIALTRVVDFSAMATRYPATTPLVWLGHMFVIVVLWVFFRADDLNAAVSYLRAMFSPAEFAPEAGAGLCVLGCLALMGLHVLEAKLLQTKANIYYLRRINRPFIYGVLFGLCLWLVMLPSYEVNPFIYFRF